MEGIKMKTKEKSFSDRAKIIINRYRPRLGKNLERHDPLAEASLKAELEALAAEQEVYKQAMNPQPQTQQGTGQPQDYGQPMEMGQPQQGQEQIPMEQPMEQQGPMAYGGAIRRLPKYYDAGLLPYSPSNPDLVPWNNLPPSFSPQQFNFAAYTPEVISQKSSTPVEPSSGDTVWSNTPTMAKWSAATQLGTGIAGAIIGSQTAPRINPDEQAVSVAPYEKVDLSEEKRQAYQNYIDTVRGARSYSPAYYSAVANDAHGRYLKERGVLTSQETNENVRGKNAYNLSTAQILAENKRRKMEAEVYNSQAENASNAYLANAVTGVGSGIAGATRDMLSYDTQNKMIQYTGTGQYFPYMGDVNKPAYRPEGTVGIVIYTDKNGVHNMVDGKEITDPNEFLRLYKARYNSSVVQPVAKTL